MSIAFKGGVLETSFYTVLQRARYILRGIKEEKLHSRRAKLIAINRLDAEADVWEVFNHRKEEVEELRIELEKGSDYETTLREIGDVINCAEIIGAAVLVKEGK
jgi:hypothetical protein